MMAMMATFGGFPAVREVFVLRLEVRTATYPVEAWMATSSPLSSSSCRPTG